MAHRFLACLALLHVAAARQWRADGDDGPAVGFAEVEELEYDVVFAAGAEPGFALGRGDHDEGLTVSELGRLGAAHESGLVRPGDALVAVNGERVAGPPGSPTALPPGAVVRARQLLRRAVDSGWWYWLRFAPPPPFGSRRRPAPLQSALVEVRFDAPPAQQPEPRRRRRRRKQQTAEAVPEEPLHHSLGVHVTRDFVVTGFHRGWGLARGPAEASGRIFVGDTLISINGENLRAMRFADAVHRLRTAP